MSNGSGKTFIVYKHTSKTTGLSYIGLTSTSIQQRFFGHVRQSKRGSGWKFHEAIRTFGEEDFESFLLCECECLDDAKEKERFYIQQFDSYRNGYNCNKGGWGGYDRTKDVTKKQSESLKRAYKEKKIKSPFSDSKTHSKTIETRSLNKSNVWVTNNPMKNKEKALEIASKRSGEKHYTFGKNKFIIVDADENKREFVLCALRDVLDFYKMPLSTYHKFVNSNKSPSRGPFKGFKIYCENCEN